MVELLEKDKRQTQWQSSKGNQLKWTKGKNWYKADYTGYEGLAEHIVSALLEKSNLKPEEYVRYDTEEIVYEKRRFPGCRSRDFLKEGWQLITLERLFMDFYGKRLYESIFSIEEHEKRLAFLVEQAVRMTGIEDFGAYISKLLTVDAFFLNEDRHTHNIAVLADPAGKFHLCPIFDNGAALLSDTTMDYPMGEAVEILMERPHSKTFCYDFDEQLDLVEKLYGRHLDFYFTRKDVDFLLDQEEHYPPEVKERVKEILGWQIRKYAYLFSEKQENTQ